MQSEMFKTTSFLYLLYAAVLTNGVCGGNFPANRQRCMAGDVKCLKTVINQYIRQSGNGIPEINLTPIDPLYVPELSIVQGSGPVNIKLNLKNLHFHGMSNTQVTRVVGFDKDPKKSKFEFYGRIPRLTILGRYKLNGKVIILPVQGDGASNMTFDNLDVSVRGSPRVDVKGGKEYLQFSKFNVDFTTTKFTMHFENLFNGNRALGMSTNQFFNENSMNILNEMKPVLRNSIGNILLKAINPVFATHPYPDYYL